MPQIIPRTRVNSWNDGMRWGGGGVSSTRIQIFAPATFLKTRTRGQRELNFHLVAPFPPPSNLKKTFSSTWPIPFATFFCPNHRSATFHTIYPPFKKRRQTGASPREKLLVSFSVFSTFASLRCEQTVAAVHFLSNNPNKSFFPVFPFLRWQRHKRSASTYQIDVSNKTNK